MEYLSKLKKDGKTVGYERYVFCDQREDYVKGKSLVPQHSKDGIRWEYIYLWELKTGPKGYWFEAQIDIDIYIEHDEKCPFVTQDKNGKDIFEGDCCHSGIVDGYICWSDIELVWKFEWFVIYGCIHSVFVAGLSDIELIEEKENEPNQNQKKS